jgi:hypothetical protein
VLGLGSVGACAIAWLYTREPVWLRRMLLAFGVSAAVALVFFAGVIIERLQV